MNQPALPTNDPTTSYPEIIVSQPSGGLRGLVRRRWGLMSITFMVGFITTVMAMSLLERVHESRVLVEILAESPATTPHYVENQFRILSSRQNLLNVVHNKGLTKRWSLGNDDNAAADKLARMLVTQLEPGTDLVSINVRSPKMEEAAELANTVADSYEERALDQIKNHAERRVNILQAEIDHEEKTLEANLTKPHSDERAALLKELRESIMRQRVALEQPHPILLRHENAYPSPEVHQPNADQLWLIGTGLSLLGALVLAWIVEWVRRMKFPAPAQLEE